MFTYPIDRDTSLELLQYKHAEALFYLTDTGRSYLGKWLPWVEYTKTIADTRAFIQSTLQDFAGQFGMTVVVLYRGAVAGVVAFHAFDWINMKTSIGYWLGEQYQGKGLITKAVKVLIDYAFGELRLNRIVIQAAEDNVKSWAIPERLGFTYEGTQRQNERIGNRWVDHRTYALLKEDWQPLTST
ncbi:GNAT family N-acetyltransferase [Texcoconibacillus texcoconensis]|uniref:Ribosomal-protein-serine acetyltransferase n=1 Tax=Texcoconibacillus texcoconensis TaxID=1095777 RepID=A0A840QPJ2_9BACI|nr:GNAT family protein [Texcoconibacillus texcoconensis]MBB5173294.1 ribosomal-protein-serine acetyltransferase [Texcoconibacillus texcoconensis]